MLWSGFGFSCTEGLQNPVYVQSFEYASPKAILSALMPRAQPTPVATDDAEVRHAAFKRFIASLERRGSSEKVPEFPSGAQWYNTGVQQQLSCYRGGRAS